MCNNCIHKAVCSIYRATGGVKKCEHHKVERRGRWVHCNGKSNLWYCSECGEKILYNQTRRTYNIEKRKVHEINKCCRACGAIMEGASEDGICKED